MRAPGESSWGSIAINSPSVLIPGAAARRVATQSSRSEALKPNSLSGACIDEEMRSSFIGIAAVAEGMSR